MYGDYMQVTPIPKHVRIRDKKLYYSYKRDYCEWCGAWKTYANLQRHHIVPRSQWGGDEHENLIMLCTGFGNDCHGKAHRGEITKDELRGMKKDENAEVSQY